MSSMKIAITGHCEGIGKAIADELSVGNDIIGFSRSNGFDIGNSEDRNKIVKTAYDADVFINNAYHPNAQTELLMQMFHSWEHTSKLIINICSLGAYHSFLPVYPEWLLNTFGSKEEIEKYLLTKKYQLAFARKVRRPDGVNLVNILPGVISTGATETVTGVKKISPKVVANSVQEVLKLQKQNIFIHELWIKTQ